MTAKGKRSISLNLDKVREIKWTFSAIEKFEQAAKAELVSQKILKETDRVEAGPVLANYLNSMPILRIALDCSLVDPVDDIGHMIDQSSLPIVDIQKAIQEAYWISVDPSRVSSLQKSWRALEDLEAMRQEAMMKDVESQLAMMKKKLSGLPSSASDSSS